MLSGDILPQSFDIRQAGNKTESEEGRW